MKSPHPPHPLRILVLLVRYGEIKYPRAVAELREFYRRLGAGVAYELVVIDNAIEIKVPPAAPAESYTLVPGDNRAFEFTGWDRALAAYQARLADYDLVHFVTDAFNTGYTGYLSQVEIPHLTRVKARGVCLGHLDAYPGPIELEGQDSQCWIRTCFFYLTPESLGRLGTMTRYRAPAGFFTDDPAAPFAVHAPLSQAYRRYILDWLTGPGLGHGPWHSRFTLTSDSLPYFRAKTTALLNEQSLSIRLRRAGVPTVDFAWLKYAIETGGAPDFGTGWAEQVEIRTGLLTGRRSFPGERRLWAYRLVRRAWRGLPQALRDRLRRLGGRS